MGREGPYPSTYLVFSSQERVERGGEGVNCGEMDLRFRSDWDELPLRCNKEQLKKMESTRQSHSPAVC